MSHPARQDPGFAAARARKNQAWALIMGNSIHLCLIQVFKKHRSISSQVDIFGVQTFASLQITPNQLFLHAITNE
jgi:hypothetical protein